MCDLSKRRCYTVRKRFLAWTKGRTNHTRAGQLEIFRRKGEVRYATRNDGLMRTTPCKSAIPTVGQAEMRPQARYRASLNNGNARANGRRLGHPSDRGGEEHDHEQRVPFRQRDTSVRMGVVGSLKICHSKYGGRKIQMSEDALPDYANAWSKFRKPFGLPACEAELETLKDEYSESYFHENPVSPADNKNHVCIEVSEPHVYQQVLTTLAARTATYRVIAIPHLIKVWEFVLWSAIFHHLRDHGVGVQLILDIPPSQTTGVAGVSKQFLNMRSAMAWTPLWTAQI